MDRFSRQQAHVRALVVSLLRLNLPFREGEEKSGATGSVGDALRDESAEPRDLEVLAVDGLRRIE